MQFFRRKHTEKGNSRRSWYVWEVLCKLAAIHCYFFALQIAASEENIPFRSMEGRASGEKTIHFYFPSLLQFQKWQPFWNILSLDKHKNINLITAFNSQPFHGLFYCIRVQWESCLEKLLEKEGQGQVEEHTVFTLKLQACLNANRDTSPTQPPTCKLKYEHSEYLSQNTALHTICSCIHILLVTSGTCTHTPLWKRQFCSFIYRLAVTCHSPTLKCWFH